MNWEDYFYYDETSETCLRWKVDIYKCNPSFLAISAGSVAGSMAYRENGRPKRCQVQVNSKVYAIHKIIWELFNGKLPEDKIIDHLDRNPFNNKLFNLAEKSIAENSRNKKLSKKNTSGVTGVGISSTRPRVSASWVDLEGKSHLKYFPIKKWGSLEAAVEAAKKHRNEMIKVLNAAGAGYTEDHGI